MRPRNLPQLGNMQVLYIEFFMDQTSFNLKISHEYHSNFLSYFLTNSFIFHSIILCERNDVIREINSSHKKMYEIKKDFSEIFRGVKFTLLKL